MFRELKYNKLRQLRKGLLQATVLALVVVTTISCNVKYSFSGASISPDAKTVSVAYFPNNAPLVAMTLSSTFTDALQEKLARQTKLSSVREDGDLSFEGEIIGYMVAPSAVSDDAATQNRLTITVKVRFANKLEPQWDYNKNFTHFADYPTAGTTLTEQEGTLIPEIVTKLVDDIFNAAVANW